MTPVDTPTGLTRELATKRSAQVATVTTSQPSGHISDLGAWVPWFAFLVIPALFGVMFLLGRFA